MTKRNSTKRALLASILSVVLCLSMLVGSTFAWFTDSASTGVNKIVAGELKIDLGTLDGTAFTSVKDETIDFIKADDSTQILWEPGCTYSLPDLYVKNMGNLAFKYQVVITGIEGSAKLNEAIEWTIDYGYEEGETEGHMAGNSTLSAPIKISGHMKEDAGNEYQGLSINGISITVVATQDTVEYDSTTDQYDDDAEAVYPVADISQAEAKMATAAPGSAITVGKAAEGALTIPATANGITVIFEGNGVDKITLAEGASDITIMGADIATTEKAIHIQLSGDHGTVALKNLNLSSVAEKNTANSAINGGSTSGGAKDTALVIDACVIEDFGYGLYDAFKGFDSLTVTNSTFENTQSWALMAQGATSSIVVDSCTFINCQAGILKGTGLQANGTFVFTNNTMIGCKVHNPYGLFQVNNTNTSTVTWSGNTFDGAEMVNPY